MFVAAHHRPPAGEDGHRVPRDCFANTPVAAHFESGTDAVDWLPAAQAGAVVQWGLQHARKPIHILTIGTIVARRLRHAPEQSARFRDARQWAEGLTRALDPGPDRFRAFRQALTLRNAPSTRAVHAAVLLAGLSRQRTMAMQSRIQLALAGLCFDLGATLLPEDATPAMWRRHPLLSVDLLAVHTEDGLLRAAVSGHHERMDGAGEPVGTHALPLAARMASLCDRAVDAFSAPAIGPPPPPYLALERLADDSGAHDPRLFLELVRLLARRDTAWRHGN